MATFQINSKTEKTSLDGTENVLIQEDGTTTKRTNTQNIADLFVPANDSITFAKVQNVSTGIVLGRTTAGTGDIEQLTDLPAAVTIGSAYIHRVGGTDVAVTDGGTGASTAADARTNLGLVIGTDVQAYDADLTTWAGLTPSAFFQTLVDDADAATGRATLGAAASGANTDLTSIYLNNTGLKVKDTNASHGLSIVPGSDLTADKTLTITTGDFDRTLTLSGDATISGTNTGDQSVATSTELNTGTDNAKIATSLALENSKYTNQNGTKISATASGTDTYTATLTPAITAYSSTQVFNIKFTNANTGASTININALGAISIVKNGSTALASGDIAAGQIYAIGYDGTNFQILSKIASGGSGDVTAAANIADNVIVRGDGGVKGVQQSGITIDDTDNITGVATITLPNTGLHILDTNASHDLIIAPGSDLTADRTLTLTTGDASRILTINADSTLSGTNTGDQTITLTGDVTGSGTGSFAATIANDAVTNAKLADVATATFKGRTTAGTGDPEDLTVAQALALLGVASGAASSIIWLGRFNNTTDSTFYLLPDGTSNITTESQTRLDMPRAGTFDNLKLNVISNGKDGATVYTLRKNGAATTLSISVNAATTGQFSDSDGVAFANNDELSYQVNASASTNVGTMISLSRVEYTA